MRSPPMRIAAALIFACFCSGHAIAADNFKICVAGDSGNFGSPQIVIPPGFLFQSWGRLIGDLSNPTPDFTWQQSDERNDHYGVVVARGVLLTKAKRCATTTVQVVLSQTWGWQHPNHLGEYLAMGILNGAPIAYIGDTKTLP
jgi:hypothetical protein